MPKDKYRYILDSSIWVEIERGNVRLRKDAQMLLSRNRICMVDLIIAELLRGARSESDYRGLKLRLLAFDVISTSWTAVGRLGFLVARAGFSPPLADLYIAQCAIEHGKVLITQDKHFTEIARVKPFKLEQW